MNPPRARFFLIATALAITSFRAVSEAALLAYEPFDYSTVAANDRNLDARKDLWGLTGGFGWGEEWVETALLEFPSDLTEYPLDYVDNLSLIEPSGDHRFSLGGSAHLYNFTQTGKPQQSLGTLTRRFASPIQAPLGGALWFSFLLRKDFELKSNDGRTRPGDEFLIGLFDEFEATGLWDPSSGTDFMLRSGASSEGEASLKKGAIVGETNLFVFRLSRVGGASSLDLFFNPPLDVVPSQPDVSIPLVDTSINDFTGFQIIHASSRPVWSVDELRVGETYNDVIPEPSSLFLVYVGSGVIISSARFRRSRAM